MSYEKDGEKYYIVDAHCHFWDASRENWKPGREEYAKGWIDCFYGYHQLAPPETHWDYEKYLKVTPEDFEQDMFDRGLRRQGRLPVDLPLRLVHRGLQHRRPQRWHQGPAPEVRRPLHRQRPVRPARRRGGPQAARRRRQEVEPEGRQGLHRRVVRRLARLAAGLPGGLPLPGEVPGAGHQEHPRPQGPHDLAAGQGRLQPRRHRRGGDRPPGPELHRRARGHPAHRGLLLHGGAGAQRVRGPVGGDRRPHARAAEVLRQGHGRAAVLGRRGQAHLRQRLQHLDAEVADRGLRRLADARRRGVHRLRQAHHGHQEEDPRPERGEALRHRGARRVRASTRPRTRPAHPGTSSSTTPRGAGAQA